MILRSPHPEVSVPDLPLPAFVLADAPARGDRPALVDAASGRALTFAGLAGGVARLAAGLAARGLRKGDVVGLFAPNLPEFAVVFHGAASAGAIVTTVNSLYTSREVAEQLKGARARFLVTVAPFLDRALPAAQSAGVEEVFVLGDAPEGTTPLASLLEADGPAPAVEVDPARDVVTLPYSSGTSGLPKGVMLSHRNLVANVTQFTAVHEVGESDVVIGVLPFFHIYGLTVILNAALQRGATVVTMPKFDLEAFLRALQDHRVTRAYVVPPIVLALAKHPLVDSFDLSSLELVMSGAAPLGAELQEAARERLGCPVMQGYGMTELSPVTHVMTDDAASDRPGSIGTLIPSTEARLEPLEGADEVTSERPGELLIRGPQAMLGYLDDAAATEAAIDSEGWLRTGDVGYADAEGYFFLVDRVKELIKYRGYQVAPAELEAILVAHPGIADAAVIPVPDEETGEVPKAYVAAAEPLSEDAVMAWVAERVAPHKKVRRVEFVEEIPKSASGKILRRVLLERERERERAAG